MAEIPSDGSNQKLSSEKAPSLAAFSETVLSMASGMRTMQAGDGRGQVPALRVFFACHCAGILAILLLLKLDLEEGCGCEETGIETEHILGVPVPPFTRT